MTAPPIAHDAGPPEPNRVLLAGDWHGDAEWAQQCLARASDLGATVMAHVGDFGLWPGPRGKQYLNVLQRQAEQLDLQLLVTPGNHEDWTRLLAREATTPGTWLKIRPRVWFAPRGHRWTWHGLRFLSVGGAVSIDRTLRTAGRTWWPEEEVTDEDADRIIAGGAADIVLAHDIPAGVPLELWPLPDWCPDWLEHQANEHRRRMARIAAGVRPQLWVGGHYHLSLDTPAELGIEGHETRVLVLDQQRTTGNLRMLELAASDDKQGTWQLSPLPPRDQW